MASAPSNVENAHKVRLTATVIGRLPENKFRVWISGCPEPVVIRSDRPVKIAEEILLEAEIIGTDDRMLVVDCQGNTLLMDAVFIKCYTPESLETVRRRIG